MLKIARKATRLATVPQRLRKKPLFPLNKVKIPANAAAANGITGCIDATSIIFFR